MAIISKSFRDFSLTFEKNPVTNDVLSLKNEKAIKESVKNIVRYNFFEKPFYPQFGGNIIGQLFENYTPGLENELSDNIERCINLYEPRVACYEVVVRFDEDSNELGAQVSYIILGLQPTVDSIDLVFKP
jgi:phage baseplate assembly protein W